MLLRVHVKLDERVDSSTALPSGPRSKRGNRYRWSSSSGGLQPLKTGTMCQAAIVVDRQSLIKLILPWTKKAVGTD